MMRVKWLLPTTHFDSKYFAKNFVENEINSSASKMYFVDVESNTLRSDVTSLNQLTLSHLGDIVYLNRFALQCV